MICVAVSSHIQLHALHIKVEITGSRRWLEELKGEQVPPCNVGADVGGDLVPTLPFGEGEEAVAPTVSGLPDDTVGRLVTSVAGVEAEGVVVKALLVDSLEVTWVEV